MEGTFAAILGRQEREDAAAAHSEAALRQAVCREFLNGEELLAASGLCLTDFFAAERTALPAVPVRTAAKFGIKKHTASQRPYRHGHDFYELICVHGGCCRQRVGDAPLLLTQGQCCLLSPGAEHEMERCGRGDVVLKLVIPAPLFAAAGGSAAGADGAFYRTDRRRSGLCRPFRLLQTVCGGVRHDPGRIPPPVRGVARGRRYCCRPERRARCCTFTAAGTRSP